mmetsp:Transcript_98853/g.229058  ORF Transcript_98853/g.229058 Transcript_98853/m.229058 type:complete len:271 (-) Transcript_98853:318-1130(-)
MPLGCVAHSTIFCPTLDECDQLLRTRFQLATLCEKGRIVERGRAVHGKVDWNGFSVDAKRCRCQESNFGFLPAECGPPKFEVPTGDKSVGTGPYGRLLQLARIKLLCPCAAQVQTTLQTRCQNIRARTDDNVHFGYCHTKGCATDKFSTCKSNHLNLWDTSTEDLLHNVGQSLHNFVAFRCQQNPAQEFLDLPVEARRREDRGRDRVRTRLAIALLADRMRHVLRFVRKISALPSTQRHNLARISVNPTAEFEAILPQLPLGCDDCCLEG